MENKYFNTPGPVPGVNQDPNNKRPGILLQLQYSFASAVYLLQFW